MTLPSFVFLALKPWAECSPCEMLLMSLAVAFLARSPLLPEPSGTAGSGLVSKKNLCIDSYISFHRTL